MSNDFSKELLEQASEKLHNISKGAEISADDMKFILTHEAMHREFLQKTKLLSEGATMMTSKAAKDVVVGDKIFNSSATHPSYSWVTVTSVREYGGSIVISTDVFDTWKHPKEAVAVI